MCERTSSVSGMEQALDNHLFPLLSSLLLFLPLQGHHCWLEPVTHGSKSHLCH